MRSCVGLFGREAVRRDIDLLQAVAHQVAGTGNRVIERQGTEARTDGFTFRVGGLGREASDAGDTEDGAEQSHRSFGPSIREERMTKRRPKVWFTGLSKGLCF